MMHRSSVVFYARFLTSMLSCIMGILCLILFLGSDIQYKEYQAELPFAFFERWLAFSIPTLVFSLVSIIIFLILNYFRKENQLKINVGLETFILVLISLVPTFLVALIFFFH